VIEMQGTSTATAQEFAELVYADPALVRAEFDAIIAANFSPVPPRRAPRPAPDRRDRPDSHRPRPTGAPGDLARTARRVGARERSPP
jgi:hypothetical protein